MQNWIQICIAASEKIHFNFLYVHDLGPKTRNDIDLQYSYNFIYSIRYQLLLPFRSLAAIVSENFTVFTFPREKPKLPNYNRSRSLKGH